MRREWKTALFVVSKLFRLRDLSHHCNYPNGRQRKLAREDRQDRQALLWRTETVQWTRKRCAAHSPCIVTSGRSQIVRNLATDED